MDEACDVTCLENKRKCKQRFAFTVAMTSREYTLFTIFTLLKIHLVSFSFGGGGGESTRSNMVYVKMVNYKKCHTHCFHTKVYFNLFLSPA